MAASAGKQSSMKLLNAGNALIVTGIAFVSVERSRLSRSICLDSKI